MSRGRLKKLLLLLECCGATEVILIVRLLRIMGIVVFQHLFRLLIMIFLSNLLLSLVAAMMILGRNSNSNSISSLVGDAARSLL